MVADAFHDLPYLGHDRRARAYDGMPPARARLVLAIAAAALLAGYGLPALVGPNIGAADGNALFSILRVLGALIWCWAGLLRVMRWRITGEAPIALSGCAFLLYGASSPASVVLDPIAPDWRLVATVRIVAALVALAFLSTALVIATVDARLRPLRLLAISVGVTAIGILALYRLLPDVATYALQAFVAALWLSIGFAFALTARRRGESRLAWTGLALCLMAFAETSRMFAANGSPTWLLASGVVQDVAGAVVFTVAVFEMLAVLADRGNRALVLDRRLQVVSARLEDTVARDEERAHDVRSALAGVQSAVATMTRHYERLDLDTRAYLQTAVEGELGRLLHLVGSAHTNDLAPFDLADVLEPVVSAQRTQGVVIHDSVAKPCVVVGRPTDTATVVHGLLDNARRHAPGSAVVLRSFRVDNRVVLAVEDRGPGIPKDERDAVFGRGVRGRMSGAVEGSGLGLFIAARLMTDQRGTIRVEDRLGGGARFVLTFAAQ